MFSQKGLQDFKKFVIKHGFEHYQKAKNYRSINKSPKVKHTPAFKIEYMAYTINSN